VEPRPAGVTQTEVERVVAGETLTAQTDRWKQDCQHLCPQATCDIRGFPYVHQNEWSASRTAGVWRPPCYKKTKRRALYLRPHRR
jgi:hypothetical protein